MNHQLISGRKLEPSMTKRSASKAEHPHKHHEPRQAAIDFSTFCWSTPSILCLAIALLLAACRTPDTQSTNTSKSNGQEGQVRELIERYFSTWSAKDMGAYGACFHEQARICFVKDGAPQARGLAEFLREQERDHAKIPVPVSEVPTGISLLVDDRIAQARVRYKLTIGTSVITGTDYFTLLRTTNGWKVLSLTFYGD